MVDALASATITNTNDDGPGSLRRAVRDSATDGIIAFCTDTTGGAVNFTDGTPHTIALTTRPLPISRNLNLHGPGANLLTISGGHTSTILEVTAGTSAVDGVTLTQGNAGAIKNSATLARPPSRMAESPPSSSSSPCAAMRRRATPPTRKGCGCSSTRPPASSAAASAPPAPGG